MYNTIGEREDLWGPQDRVIKTENSSSSSHLHWRSVLKESDGRGENNNQIKTKSQKRGKVFKGHRQEQPSRSSNHNGNSRLGKKDKQPTNYTTRIWSRTEEEEEEEEEDEDEDEEERKSSGCSGKLCRI